MLCFVSAYLNEWPFDVPVSVEMHVADIPLQYYDQPDIQFLLRLFEYIYNLFHIDSRKAK